MNLLFEYYKSVKLFQLSDVGDDTTPPVIDICPNSINVTTPVGMTSTPVTWIEPTATDNSGMTPTVTQSHQSGDRFPIGISQVFYTFSDLAGNEAACTFSITNGNLHA